jgi:scyllo-inositol 2-dehydrogenase (NAD+)
MTMPARINIGVIGLGRMGQLYAHFLATQVPGAHLFAVSEVDEPARARFAAGYDVSRIFADPFELLNLPELEAVVIATPTSTHHDLVMAAAQAGKAIFCEKPLALDPVENVAMIEATEKAGVPLQVGFMRRFDAGYQRAKMLIDEGRIGAPVTFKSLSRDPFCPPKNYLDPQKNGGLLVDMGIHDFDLARWLMGGEIQRVSGEGTTLVCEDLKAVRDFDNAVVVLRFVNGALGHVEASRNAFYGYDIRTEVLGSEGALMIGAQQHTPVLLLTRSGAQHDTMPYLMERFGDAYREQLRHFVECLQTGRAPSVGGREALAALKIAIAAQWACGTQEPIWLGQIDDAFGLEHPFTNPIIDDDEE